jgi:hypothetical protein
MKILRQLGLTCLGSGLVYWLFFAIGVPPTEMFLIYGILFSATSAVAFVVFALFRLHRRQRN